MSRIYYTYPALYILLGLAVMMSFALLALRAPRCRLRPLLNSSPLSLQQLGTRDYIRDYIHTSRDNIAGLLEYKPVDAIKDIEVNGFVRSVRSQKRYHFVSLGDGSTLEPLQAVVPAYQAEGWEICV